MATFSENINKIRGEAIYGGEMRTAIADAILQAVGVEIRTLDISQQGDTQIYIQLNPIVARRDDYLMTIKNVQEGYVNAPETVSNGTLIFNGSVSGNTLIM